MSEQAHKLVTLADKFFYLEGNDDDPTGSNVLLIAKQLLGINISGTIFTPIAKFVGIETLDSKRTIITENIEAIITGLRDIPYYAETFKAGLDEAETAVSPDMASFELPLSQIESLRTIKFLT